MAPILKKGSGKYSSVGVDVGEGQLKLVQLKEEKGEIHLHDYGLHTLPEGIVEEGELRDPHRFSNQLNYLLKRFDFAGDKVNICIDHISTHCRQLFLPTMSQKEIEGAIRFEAEKFAAAPLESYIVDYVSLGQKEVEGQKANEVVLVMVNRRMVEDYLKPFTYAGYRPQVVEIAPFPLERLVKQMSPHYVEQNFTGVILNIGAENSTLLVLENGRYGFSRNLNVGSRHFWKALTDSRGGFGEEDEEEPWESEYTPFFADMKTFFEKKEFQLGMEYRDGVFDPEAVQEVALDLSFQLRRSLDYYLYKMQREDVDLQKVYLCGEIAGIKGMEDFLAEELSMEVKLLNPLYLFADQQGEGKIENGEILAVATGLAYRGWKA